MSFGDEGEEEFPYYFILGNKDFKKFCKTIY